MKEEIIKILKNDLKIWVDDPYIVAEVKNAEEVAAKIAKYIEDNYYDLLITDKL